MVEIVRLKAGEQPPPNERFIHVVWKPGESDVMVSQTWGTTYRVPSRLWDEWMQQAPGLAERIGLRKLYITDRPEPAKGSKAGAAEAKAQQS